MLPIHHIEFTDDCWLWHGPKTSRGYGKFRDTTAHRVIYELIVGPIPSGHDLHHLCRVRACVNPRHLLPIESKEHRYQSRTHCPYGHPYDAANTYVTKQGKRQCRACNRERHRASYKRKGCN